MKRVLTSLAEYRDWKLSNKEVSNIIKSKSQTVLTQKYLKKWRTEMYLLDQEKNLAHPHFLKVVQKYTLRRVFDGLRQKVHKKV
jgi:hypothetical protein